MALAALVLLAGAAPAAGGNITINMTTTASYRDGAVTVELTVGNSGDEAASNVVPVLRFRDAVARGTLRDTLPPTGRFQETLRVPAPDLGEGRWPFRIAVDYTDANQYPFQALHAAVLPVGTPSPAKVAVTAIEAGRLSRTGAVEVQVKNLAAVARAVGISVFVPEGLEADPASTLELPPWEEETVRAELINRTGLPGSRYPVFVAAEYEEDGVHHAVVSQGLVEIVSPRADFSRTLLWAGAALVLGWIVVVALRMRRRA
jgi:hypothetical protein